MNMTSILWIGVLIHSLIFSSLLFMKTLDWYKHRQCLRSAIVKLVHKLTIENMELRGDSPEEIARYEKTYRRFK